MRRRHSNRLAATLVVVAVIAALALVTSPELRALLLFADSLGLDLLALLLATQLRHFGYVLLPGAKARDRMRCQKRWRHRRRRNDALADSRHPDI